MDTASTPSRPDMPSVHDVSGGHEVSAADLRAGLRSDFEACRAGTLDIFEGMTEAEFREPIHPQFSPLGWHLGHIAYTEAAWLIAKCGERPLPRPEFEGIFHVDAVPKAERSRRIPDLDTVKDYAASVRTEMLDCLDAVPIDRQERLWRFVLQHEAQHTETVQLLLALRESGNAKAAASGGDRPAIDWVALPGGSVTVGLESADALDNECPRHAVTLAPFEIARDPVRQAQYAAFMADGGYVRRELWSDAGWAWLQAEPVEAPLYWRPDAPDLPGCGVSAHEAEAFCRWAGGRLPTEFEWEAATAQVKADGGPRDMLGHVWEWTASTFAPYPGFEPWPYPGYSQTYFDGRHRVLRGGSWATRPWARRPSFRNWYTPDTRQIFAGFRCARDAGPGQTQNNRKRVR